MERYKRGKEKLEERRINSIIKNYYSKEINKGKSVKATYFDKIAFVLILFVFFVMIFDFFTETLIFPIILSMIVVALIVTGTYRITEKKEKQKINKVKEDLKSKRIQRVISQLNRNEFIDYVKGILERFYQSEFLYGEDGVDLFSIINDKRYAVKCLKTSLDDRIINKRVNEFYNYISYLNYDEGIMITNSYFKDNMQNETSLILFDFNNIKEILHTIGEYPGDEEINTYILQRYDDRRRDMKSKMSNITVRKIINLYIISILLYGMSFFTVYSYYYRIISIVSFLIATFFGGIRITESVKYNQVKR